MRKPENREKISRLMLSEKNPSTKCWIFEKNTGEKFKRFSFKRACKEFGISYGTMRKWIHKLGFNRMGWRVYDENNICS